MRFKEFMENGLFGKVADMGGAGLVSDVIAKHVRLPSAATPSSNTGPKLTKPARPAGMISHKKPNTLPSNLV